MVKMQNNQPQESSGSATTESAVRFQLSPRQTTAWDLLENPSVKEVLFGGAKGGGKATSLDTPILTVDGWKTMGTIRVGNQVFDERGVPCSVIGRSPVYRKHDCYKVRFSDGSEIVADKGHEWFTEMYRERCNNARHTEEFRAARRLRRPSRGTGKKPDLALRNAARQYKYKQSNAGGIRTTEEIAQTLYHNEFINHSVRVCDPLQYPQADLSIPPYTLGVWLGDGTARNGAITNPDLQVIDEIRKDGFVLKKQKSNKFGWGIRGLAVMLKAMGLYRNKHIPDEYKRGSIEQRLSLLQGLIDSDGHVTDRGSVEICLSDERLAHDVHELIVGLGIKVTIRQSEAWLKGKRCKDRYRIKFCTALPVCRLYRKKIRQNTNPTLRTRRRYIVACDRVTTVPVRCIEVDSPSRLYLAGKSLIPTHNSYLGCMWSFWLCLKIIEDCKIESCKRPIPVGFLGRKISKHFTDTTLETWIKAIPSDVYELRTGDKEIVIGGKVKLDYGGLDNRETLSKFNSAEYAFFFLDQAEECTRDDVSTLRATRRLVINDITIPPKGLFTANPAASFLKEEFIDKPTADRRFVQSLPADNPWLPQGYVDELKDSFKHRPELIEAYLYGSWDVLEGTDQVIQAAWLRNAAEVTFHKPYKRRLLACDVARFGDDETVIYYMEETDILDEKIYGKKDLVHTANLLHVTALERKVKAVVVDGDGVGGGVVDQLRQMAGDQYEVIEINSAAKSNNLAKFHNVRAEMWWKAAEDLAAGDVELKHDDLELRRQLCAPRYHFRNTRIVIEPKEDIKKRLGRSPDRADAWIMGNYALDRISPDLPRRRRSYKDAYREGSELSVMAM